MPAAPLCFVLMPFGTKPDPARRAKIPFDEIYKRAIRPAVEAAGMTPIRGDAEVEGGIVQKVMFERLILCDYAIADLTTGNANVYYELGIRHAVRPHTTIPICAQHHLPAPFDVSHVRMTPYELDRRNRLGEVAAARLRGDLTERLSAVLGSDHAGFKTDSPVYQLLNGMPQPDIERLRSEAFHQRASYSEGLKEKLTRTLSEKGDDAKRAALTSLTDEVRPEVETLEAAFLMDLFMAHRAASDFEGMVRFYDDLPGIVAKSRLAREQYALALNRLGEGDRALAILREVAAAAERPSSETQGLIGRIYKDRWTAAHAAGAPTEKQHLSDAIAAYRKGFESDWRDAYPGINLLTLLELSGAPEDLAERDRLVPVVLYAVERRLAQGDGADYWDYATLLELAVLGNDRDQAGMHLGSALALNTEAWMPASTAENLQKLVDMRRARGEDVDWIEALITSLRASGGGG